MIWCRTTIDLVNILDDDSKSLHRKYQRYTAHQQDHGLRHERYGMRHERHEALLSVTIRHERHVCVALRHEASRDTNKKASKASRCVTERHERYENVTKRDDASRRVTILSVTSVTKVVSMILQSQFSLVSSCT